MIEQISYQPQTVFQWLKKQLDEGWHIGTVADGVKFKIIKRDNLFNDIATISENKGTNTLNNDRWKGLSSGLIRTKDEIEFWRWFLSVN